MTEIELQKELDDFLEKCPRMRMRQWSIEQKLKLIKDPAKKRQFLEKQMAKDLQLLVENLNELSKLVSDPNYKPTPKAAVISLEEKKKYKQDKDRF